MNRTQLLLVMTLAIVAISSKAQSPSVATHGSEGHDRHGHGHEEAHHHDHLQVFNGERNGKPFILLVVWSGGNEDKLMGEALSESFEKSGYRVEQERAADGVGVTLRARLKIDKKDSGDILFQASADKLRPESYVIGHYQQTPGMDRLAAVIREIAQKREECQNKVGLPFGSPFFDKDERLRGIVVDDKPFCAEPVGDLALLNSSEPQRIEELRKYIAASQFEMAAKLILELKALL